MLMRLEENIHPDCGGGRDPEINFPDMGTKLIALALVRKQNKQSHDLHFLISDPSFRK